MANQSPDRRQVLEMLARVAAIGSVGGFNRWACAASPITNADTPRKEYTPAFFNRREYDMVEKIASLIIPADESPGAQEAGVAEFIDFMTSHDVEMQFPMRTGLTWLDAFANRIYSSDFGQLGETQQEALLRKLAYKKEQSPSDVEGQEFFQLIRKYTVIGYYTSRIGLESLDYPGLKLYSASPECTHHDDREHRKLAGA